MACNFRAHVSQRWKKLFLFARLLSFAGRVCHKKSVHLVFTETLHKVKGAFSTPVYARKQTNGPPGSDQGFLYSHLQPLSCTVTHRGAPTHLPVSHFH